MRLPSASLFHFIFLHIPGSQNSRQVGERRAEALFNEPMALSFQEQKIRGEREEVPLICPSAMSANLLMILPSSFGFTGKKTSNKTTTN